MGHAASSARWRYACVSHADAGAVGGPILPPGCPHVLIGNMPAACMGDSAVCVGPPDVIIKGSSSVLIGGRPAARMGDQTAHGGQIVMGCPTVIIGGEITYWPGSGWRPHRGCDRWVRLRALRASIAASLPGSFLPKLSMLSNPSLSDFRVDKNKTRSDMLGGFLIWRNSGKRLAHRIGSFSLDRNGLPLRGLPTNRSFCGRGSGRELF